jgi:Questin oxidase-like
VVRRKTDAWAVLEEYLFDTKMNFDASRSGDKRQPEMLNRFLDGLLHPMIHAGYGVEFGIPGIFAEGKLLVFY